MLILSLNAGSNSLKFTVVECSENQSAGFGARLIAGVIDDIGKPRPMFHIENVGPTGDPIPIPATDYAEATGFVLDWFDSGHAKPHGVASLHSLSRIGHRVVHGGADLSRTVLITDAIVAQIKAARDFAPYHTEASIQVIEVCRSRIAESIPMYAAFDTDFHRFMPETAGLYPLPLSLATQLKVRRYGFHGLSHRFMMMQYSAIVSRSVNRIKLITLHLEGGSSAAAIRHGRSIDTSMGLTPLEGLMMGSRSGDLDPGLVLYVMRTQGWDCDEMENFLNKDCGLQGVSGISADTRELVKRLDEPNAALAIDMFCYRVKKYIGAYIAVLGGAEAIVFGGGIGENTPLVREKICAGLDCCGAILDKDLNCRVINRQARISTADSPIAIWVIPTDENMMLAAEVAQTH
jgi:acetate kinase